MELTGKSYLITMDEDVQEVQPANGKTFELEEAQKFVDGYIEIVYLPGDFIMIVNEEGKYYKNLNSIATWLARMHHVIMPNDYICGDVVVCRSEMLP